MNTSIKNILIGLFVLCAMGIVVFILLFLHPTVGDNKKTLRVRFTDIDKVNVGTRVTYAGRAVGEVVSITEIPEARTSRLNQNGEVYVYEIVLKVDSKVDVYNTDIVTLRTSGLLGERNIEIDPKPLRSGEVLERVEDTIIFAASTSSVETTLKQFELLSEKFGIVLDDFHLTMSSIQNEKIIEKASHSIENIVEITDILNDPAVWKSTLNNVVKFSEGLNQSLEIVDASLKNMQELTTRANTEWSDSVGQSLQAVQQTTLTAQDIAQKADEIITNTQAGKGTVGQLLVGNELYLRLKSVMFKGSTIMNDISTYGVLFHLDKKWQRLQAKRAQFLQKLSSPQVFENYFENEVAQISSSLSQVSLLLNQTNDYPYSLMGNPYFIEQFGDLLKRVETMEDTLNMYNEQVMDQNN